MGDLWGFIGSIKGLAAILGVSVLTLLGVMAVVRRAAADCADALAEGKWFYAKYIQLFRSPEVQADFWKLRDKTEKATESMADVADKLRQKKIGDKLRGIIR